MPVSGFCLALLEPAEWQAVWLSLKVALWCTLCCMPLAVVLGWMLARWRFWGKGVLDVLVHVPLVLPPVVVGYGLLLLFGRGMWLGDALAAWLGRPVPFSFWAAVIASTVVALPLAVRASRIAFETIDGKQVQAAQVHGGSPWATFWWVAVPAAWPGVLAGAVLAFARSLGEFGATITFAGNVAGETRTLPLAVYQAMETPGGDAAVSRLALAAVALSIVAMAVGHVLLNHRGWSVWGISKSEGSVKPHKPSKQANAGGDDAAR